jgi:hypothetical protein
MSLFSRSTFKLVPVLAALTLTLVPRLPLVRAADEADSGGKVDLTEQTTVLQMDLQRLYDLIARDADPQTKVTLLGHHRELTNRANRLLDKFDPAKYDELRYDINIQCQRLARKQAPLAMPPAGWDKTMIPDLALEDLHPSPANKAEVAAALDAVDVTIRRHEERLGRMPVNTNQYETERDLIQHLKIRRAALGREFTQANWDGLVSEVRPAGQ